MNYPFWDTGIAYGYLMAAMAVFHVFISHFAIGGGLYLVVTEHFARRRDDSALLGYLERLSKFFILVTLVAGAVTGVGIWFIIGLLNPTATEALIHNFVWAWASEWAFFVIEIAAAILYYYGWHRLSPKNHLTLGWIYFIAAWMSLFIINGIITYMLTPGTWLATGNVWDGFFNPTFWPSLVFRTGITIMLAGMYAMLVIARSPANDFKVRTVRLNAYWGLAGLVITIPSFYWYWHAIPATITADLSERMSYIVRIMRQGDIYAVIIAVLLVLFGLLIPRRQGMVTALVLMLAGLAYFGCFEWFREAVRKPYVISEYIYGNGLEVAKADTYRAEGYLSQIKFRTGDDGADLFRHACRSCHTISGYKSLNRYFDGTDKEFIAAMVRGVGVMRAHMPDFFGTEEESQMLAAHLYEQTDQRPLSRIYNLQGVELGHKVYDIRCGACHRLGGFSDVTEALVGLSDEEYNDMLDMAGDLAEEMPAFTADDTERAALILFLKTLREKEGGTDATAGL